MIYRFFLLWMMFIVSRILFWFNWFQTKIKSQKRPQSTLLIYPRQNRYVDQLMRPFNEVRPTLWFQHVSPVSRIDSISLWNSSSNPFVTITCLLEENLENTHLTVSLIFFFNLLWKWEKFNGRLNDNYNITQALVMCSVPCMTCWIIEQFIKTYYLCIWYTM